jgi:hypothetical protein
LSQGLWKSVSPLCKKDSRIFKIKNTAALRYQEDKGKTVPQHTYGGAGGEEV